jgi:hypothetical protein
LAGPTAYFLEFMVSGTDARCLLLTKYLRERRLRDQRPQALQDQYLDVQIGFVLVELRHVVVSARKFGKLECLGIYSPVS